MNTQTKNPLSTFKKSVLSIVVLSAVTGGLVLLEKYRNEKSTMSFSEHLSRYSVPAETDSSLIESERFFKQADDNSLLTTDKDELAIIAEQHLITDITEVSDDNSVDTSETIQAVNDIEEAVVKSNQLVDEVSMSATVLFALSSSEISPEYKLALSDIALQINNENNDTKWQVVGHTDKSGRASYNLTLAKLRAQNVALFLIEQGVDESQLTLVTLGEHEAKKQDNSTYNKGLRKVEVKQYDDGVIALAKQVEKENQKEQKLIDMKREKQQQLALKHSLSDDKPSLNVTTGIQVAESGINEKNDEVNKDFSVEKIPAKGEVVINEEEVKNDSLNQDDVTSLNDIDESQSSLNEVESKSNEMKLSANHTNNYVL